MQDIYIATFIFQKKAYDDEFYALDDKIADYAKQSEGYLGDESYENPQTGQLINLYYWQGKQGMEDVIHNKLHGEAKSKQARWLNGYQVTISKLEAAYNDGVLPHPLAHIKPR